MSRLRTLLVSALFLTAVDPLSGIAQMRINPEFCSEFLEEYLLDPTATDLQLPGGIRTPSESTLNNVSMCYKRELLEKSRLTRPKRLSDAEVNAMSSKATARLFLEHETRRRGEICDRAERYQRALDSEVQGMIAHASSLFTFFSHYATDADFREMTQEQKSGVRTGSEVSNRELMVEYGNRLAKRTRCAELAARLDRPSSGAGATSSGRKPSRPAGNRGD